MDELEQLLIRQERDCAALASAVEAAEAKVQRLDPSLRPDVLKSRAADIRQEAAKGLEGLRGAIAKRAETAAALARRYTPEGERRAARFHGDTEINANMTIATFTRLGRTPTPELLAHLEDAIETDNLALAEAVRLEFGARSDASAVQDEWRAIFGKLKSPNAERAAAAINRVIGLKGMGDERVLTLVRGHGRGDPVARITAARQMVA